MPPGKKTKIMLAYMGYLQLQMCWEHGKGTTVHYYIDNTCTTTKNNPHNY